MLLSEEVIVNSIILVAFQKTTEYRITESQKQGTFLYLNFAST